MSNVVPVGLRIML